MNLLLLSHADLKSETSAVITGEKATHKIQAHNLTEGITIRVGILGGRIGFGTVTSLQKDLLEISLTLDRDPPARIPIIMIVAACRPQTVKKVIQAAVTFGIEELHFIRTERVEKSYLSSTALQDPQIAIEIEKGLSQAVDTVAPHIAVHQKFLPFFEDTLPERLKRLEWNDAKKLLADTGNHQMIKQSLEQHTSSHCIVAVGPEAGWSEFERDRLAQLQFEAVSLGDRMLRVETAVTALIGIFSLS